MYRLLSKEARTPKHRIPKVVVFIPLPVEFGEAPMNINTIQRIAVAPEIPSIGIVLNPAVRKVAEWKKLIRILPPKDSFVNSPV